MEQLTSYGIRKEIDFAGRVTLPKEFRTALHMEIGDTIEICHTDAGILIKKINTEEKVDG